MTPSVEQIIKSFQELPAGEQEEVRRWLEDQRTFTQENTSRSGNGRAENALRWLNENRQKYLGQWVALDGDRLIANGHTAKEVYARAKAEGVKVPFVELVMEEEPPPFTGGWLS
jgi:hypothetical protein